MTVKKRVLFFDDEPIINLALAESLNEFYDWDVTFVSDINELFKKLMNFQQFDILIFDIMMPVPETKNRYVDFSQREIEEMNNGMNTGVVIAKKIWLFENYKDIPILFLSAKNNPIENDIVLKGKNCSYLRKPEITEKVNEELIQLLKNI